LSIKKLGISLENHSTESLSSDGGLLAKYGRSDWLKETGLEEPLNRGKRNALGEEAARQNEAARGLEKARPNLGKSDTCLHSVECAAVYLEP